MRNLGANLVDLEKRLLSKGYPIKYVERVVQELQEHWEDARDQQIHSGASETEAGTLAAELLGDSREIEQSIRQNLQNATWIGRHRFLFFTITPLALIASWWLCFLIFQGWASGTLEWSEDKSAPQPVWEYFQTAIRMISLGGAIVLPLLFCRLSERFYLGYQWAGIGCAVIAIHNLLHRTVLTPPSSAGNGGFTWAYTATTNLQNIPWSAALLPMAVWILFRYSTRLRNAKNIKLNF